MMSTPDQSSKKKDYFSPFSPSSPCVYGIYAPSNTDEGDDGINLVTSDAEEALKLAKKCRNARFKQFQSYEEAERFAHNGPTVTLASRLNVASEKGSPHKSLRTQEMVQFRRAIEKNDLEAVKKMLSDNPRYLVSCGDTPSLVQEGFRYNSLHVAAKSNCPDIADYILTQLGSVDFMKYLYGEDEVSDCLKARCSKLIDLYLNTPEIGFNETPLHFASKFGHLDIIKILISFPECNKERRNKYNETALDMVGSRNSKISEETRNEIITLLDNDYYVAVLRSSDLSVEAVLADPFPLQSPPSQNRQALSPDMKITALAGPMKEEDAIKFKKKWKVPRLLPMQSPSPSKSPANQSQVNSPLTSVQSPLSRGMRSPIASPMSPCASSPSRLSLLYPETRLECIGRDLSSNHNVLWREFWPFLNCYANFKTSYGLFKLEKHLENQYKKSAQLSPISQLCQLLDDFSLNEKSEKQYEQKDKSYLFIESTCSAYAKKLSYTISLMDYRLLQYEISRLEALISSCAGDRRYSSIDFSRIHSRIALMMHEKYLQKQTPGLLKFLEGIVSTDSIEAKKSQTIICICSKLLNIMQVGSKKWIGKENCAGDFEIVMDPPRPFFIQKLWLSLPVCSCTTSSKPKLPRYSANKRRLELELEDSSDEELTDNSRVNRSHNILKIDQNMNPHVANQSNGNYDSDIDDSSDESYHSALSSPLHFMEDSFDSFCAAEDGASIFIDGTSASIMDQAVFDAVDEEMINPKKFPYIFLWYQGYRKLSLEQTYPKVT